MVYNLGNQYRIVVLAIVGDCAVGACHLQEVDIAGTEGERWGVIQRTIDTHLLGSLDDALDTHLLS